MTTKLTHVAAAVILKDDHFLLACRPEGKPYPGYWEFPGGKIESNESAYDALVRELYEELGITVRQAYPWITKIYSYTHATVCLQFFCVVAWDGEPHGRENQKLAWQTTKNLTVSPMLPANWPILKALSIPSIYVISNAREIGIARFLAGLERGLKQGIRLVQIREPGMPNEEWQSFYREVLARAEVCEAKVLVNSRHLPIYDGSGNGLHLTSRDLMQLRQRPEHELVAASCHNDLELKYASTLDLDFVVLGPVKPTLSHPKAQPIGWENFADWIKGLPMPVFALGGMGYGDLAVARTHGAHGISFTRALLENILEVNYAK